MQSYNYNHVGFSAEVSEALKELKEFNYKKIYKSPLLKKNHSKIKQGFNLLFEYYLKVLESNDTENEIYHHFLNTKNELYKENSRGLIVRDFIAGMTDRYFTKVLNNFIMPEITSLKI